MYKNRNERTCGNCCFCKSESVYSTVGQCVMDKLKPVRKGSSAEGMKCKKHLFKEEKKENV